MGEDISLLTEALKAAATQARLDVATWTPGTQARWGAISPAATNRFADAMRSCPEIVARDKMMIVAPDNYFLFDIEYAAIYLVDRAIEGKEREIAESLVHFFRDQKFERVSVRFFDGVQPSDMVNLGHGWRIVPAASVPACRPSAAILAQEGPPSGAVIWTEEFKVEFEAPPPPGTAPPPRPMPALALAKEEKRLHHALYSMMLVTGGIAQFREQFKMVTTLGWPFMNAPGFGGGALANPGRYNAPLDDAAFLHVYHQMEKHSKGEKIALACSKIASSRQKHSLTDRIIDLGTCLEIILMDEEGGEIKYKVATRAAWLLGKDFESRKEIFEIARDLYDSRSKAVHTGKLMQSRLKPKSASSPFMPHQLYDELCSDLIRRILSAPEWPKWNELVLGG